MKKAIVFVDANNWYHNVKKFFEPGEVDITKVAEFLCNVKKIFFWLDFDFYFLRL